MTDIKKKKSWFSKFKKKYRFVVMNESTFEEKFTFRLSRMNVFIVFGAIAISLIIGTTYLIAFTPLKEFIPDYASDVKMRQNFENLSLKTDSLERAISAKENYILAIKSVIEGKDQSERDFNAPIKSSEQAKYESMKNDKSEADAELRDEIEKADQYSLNYDEESTSKGGINDYFFFTPLKGVVLNGFNPSEKHYGIDIASKPNEAVKATLDGTIVFTGWTLETGYVVAIQHTGNLISYYMHNSSILKQKGAFVKAGEAIAIVGNSGSLSTGPHLHFEIWYNGYAVNPKNYMVFN
ncbi:MAG: M23 family metallopeptidase [Bacteroidota bacterium]